MSNEHSGELFRRLSSDDLRRPYYAPSMLSGGLFRTILLAASLIALVIYGALFAFFAPYLMVQLTVPIIILVLIVIWALPSIKATPARLMETLLLTFLGCSVLWPNYLAVSVAGLPWITISRITNLALVAVFLVSLSTSSDFRVDLSRAIREAPVVYKLVTCFVLLQFVSLFISIEKGDSINRFVVAQANWTIPFICAAFLFQKPNRANHLASLICFTSGVLCCVALLEHRLGKVPWVGHIPDFLRIEDPNVARILAGTSRLHSTVHRTQATFGTSLGLSEYLAITFPFLAHFAIGRYSVRIRLFAGLMMPIVLTAILMTQARIGVVGVFVCALAYPALVLVLRWRAGVGRHFTATVVYLSPILFAGAVAVALIVPGIRMRLLGGGGERGSTQARFDQLHMGLPKLLSHPWGYGIGQGANALGYHSDSGFLTIDSYPLRLALEYGVLGLVVFYAIFCVAIVRALSARLATNWPENELNLVIPASISLMSCLVMKTAFSQEDNLPIMFVLLGMLTALAGRLRGTDKEPSQEALPGVTDLS